MSREAHRTAIVCGTPLPAAGYCDEDLWRTLGPASSLWCPWHGHVLDVPPSPPLTGVVILCGPGGASTRVDLARL